MRSSTAAVAVLLWAWSCSAAPCAADDDGRAHAEVRYLLSGGDIYGPLANDGEERGGSYAARISYDVSGWRLSYEFRRSIYTTENAGPSSFTQFPVLGGGFGEVPFFDAVEATSEYRIERRIGRSRLAVGLGYFLATTNYAFPHLAGPGLTLERPADTGRGLKAYASVGYYLVHGSSPSAAAHFRVATADAGIVYRIHENIALVGGYANELRQPVGLSSGGLLLDRSLPYFGLALRY